MTSRFLRSLLLASALALTAGLAGAVSPHRVAPNPTDTRVRNIDIDSLTILELQDLMN